MPKSFFTLRTKLSDTLQRRAISELLHWRPFLVAQQHFHRSALVGVGAAQAVAGVGPGGKQNGIAPVPCPHFSRNLRAGVFVRLVGHAIGQLPGGKPVETVRQPV